MCKECEAPGPNYVGEGIAKDRRLNRRKQHREFRQERLKARLRCPDCGSGHKTMLNRRWICRNCLTQMVRP